MRKMRDSGVAWIGEIPEGWEVCKTKQIFSVYNGSTPKSDNAEYWDGNIIWITPAEMGENVDLINDSKRKITNLGLSSCGTTVVPKNSIVLSSRAPIGQVAIAGAELCTNQGCKSLVKKDNINEKFFYYFFKIQSEPLNMLGKGTTFLELSSSELENFFIPNPSAPEQHRITAYLDTKYAEIDRSMELVRQGMDKLKEYKKSVITEAVTKGLDPDAPMKDSGVAWIGEIPAGWSIVPLKKQLTNIVDYRGKTPEKVNSGIFLVTAKNIKNGKIDYAISQEYVDEKDYSSIMGRGLPKIGDILFTTEAPLGEIAIVDKEDIALAQRIIKFTVNSDILNNLFLKYWMTLSGFQFFLHSLSTGSTAEGIKASKIFMLPLVLPPLPEQHRIAAFLDAKCAEIDTLLAKKQALLDKLAEYKKSLIFECVTGKREVAA